MTDPERSLKSRAFDFPSECVASKICQRCISRPIMRNVYNKQSNETHMCKYRFLPDHLQDIQCIRLQQYLLEKIVNNRERFSTLFQQAYMHGMIL